MSNAKRFILDTSIVCPLCGHDEYLISACGEKFTCGDCGFYTEKFSQIVSLVHISNKTPPPFIHQTPVGVQ